MNSAAASISVSAPSNRREFWQTLLIRQLARLECGRVVVRFSGSREHHLNGPGTGPSADITIHDRRIFDLMIRRGVTGLGEAYMEGYWTTPDLGAVLSLGLANAHVWDGLMVPPRLTRLISSFQHWLNRNSKAGSRRNISFHYDLGNDFYREWLDASMTYSSALYASPDQSFEAAQNEKYRRIIRTLGLGPDDHVLEIGCGWGGFAELAIRETGCRVTGLTLSREQAGFARDRLSAAGLADRSEIRLQDYRDCEGQFSHIVSIEMMEAVGEANWPTYFRTIRSRLKPGGSAVIQVITIAERDFDDYRASPDFIQTYIFPGGMLPPASVFSDQALRQGLKLEETCMFGPDYARTLRQWDRAFQNAWPRIEALGYDERFRRMWRFYLNYCAAGFEAARIDVGQFKLSAVGG